MQGLQYFNLKKRSALFLPCKHEVNFILCHRYIYHAHATHIIEWISQCQILLLKK